MSLDAEFKLMIALGVILICGILGYAVWFDATHDCVRSHRDTCTTTQCVNTSEFTSSCTSVSYECVQCDEWVKKP